MAALFSQNHPKLHPFLVFKNGIKNQPNRKKCAAAAVDRGHAPAAMALVLASSRAVDSQKSSPL